MAIAVSQFLQGSRWRGKEREKLRKIKTFTWSHGSIHSVITQETETRTWKNESTDFLKSSVFLFVAGKWQSLPYYNSHKDSEESLGIWKEFCFCWIWETGLGWLSINVREKVKEHYFSIKAKVSTLTLNFRTPHRSEDRSWSDSDTEMNWNCHWQ